MKKVLNVGGGDRLMQLPPQYAEFEHLLLDIDPRGSPDIVCDARNLTTLEADQVEAVYCAHNLEHYYRHDVPKVLAGFLHVLKDGGFVHIRVPDIQAVMQATLDRGLDIEDYLYESAMGPITVLDVLYGWGVEIERSGQGYYAHKTGFTRKSLVNALKLAGFLHVYAAIENFEVDVLAFKKVLDRDILMLFNIPD